MARGSRVTSGRYCWYQSLQPHAAGSAERTRASQQSSIRYCLEWSGGCIRDGCTRDGGVWPETGCSPCAAISPPRPAKPERQPVLARVHAAPGPESVRPRASSSEFSEFWDGLTIGRAPVPGSTVLRVPQRSAPPNPFDPGPHAQVMAQNPLASPDSRRSAGCLRVPQLGSPIPSGR